ncbi:hypothetical protein PNK_1266 [Candidatus Protochlamydia naegleriophila]|uniref:Uncharacterized protein n=1 Tax=Candidatus Protochlamydia naegleriophila TaxID=389348 RepID=A0A0U5ERS9_9BACT|nr:hypothetical protein [Candidatus Protochlamydia naegleriophila]CUI16883.1 hypothetical protein PNK_1266 [Candidatus Protochlamydia naegleriophila]
MKFNLVDNLTNYGLLGLAGYTVFQSKMAPIAFFKAGATQVSVMLAIVYVSKKIFDSFGYEFSQAKDWDSIVAIGYVSSYVVTGIAIAHFGWSPSLESGGMLLVFNNLAAANLMNWFTHAIKAFYPISNTHQSI